MSKLSLTRAVEPGRPAARTGLKIVCAIAGGFALLLLVLVVPRLDTMFPPSRPPPVIQIDCADVGSGVFTDALQAELRRDKCASGCQRACGSARGQ